MLENGTVSILLRCCLQELETKQPRTSLDRVLVLFSDSSRSKMRSFSLCSLGWVPRRSFFFPIYVGPLPVHITYSFIVLQHITCWEKQGSVRLALLFSAERWWWWSNDNWVHAYGPSCLVSKLPFLFWGFGKMTVDCETCPKINPKFSCVSVSHLIIATQPFERLFIDFEHLLFSTRNWHFVTIVHKPGFSGS